MGGFGNFGAFGPSGSWNESRNYTPAVLYDADQFSGHGARGYYKMWRSGTNTSGNKTIGLAVSTTPATGADTTSLIIFASLTIGLGLNMLRLAVFQKR